ncbi:hypothetical protein [Antrihabitans sp. YC2-6]|uniref:DUF6912 family protein n=1 Tax=Antrihabitans sp. YC2-6 TaxID=2799498 RepID=UPI0018F49998|nr:hypothetical protein [Antrihabitans sp. YC2-6]MBJ8347289.1 hypothetical protein [Antrihabitans sp. YC2-6]
MLRTLVTDREFVPINGTAFAVTPALREAYSSGDDDELAEVAMAEAARASLRLLAAELEDDPAGVVHRRAVVAADVDDVKLRPDLDDSVVRVQGPITFAQVASAHVDLAEAESVIEKAIGVVDQADLGDVDAEFVVGDAEDHELAWYATQELSFLVELL